MESSSPLLTLFNSTEQTPTTSTPKSPATEEEDPQQELYRIITIGIVTIGLLLMIFLTCYVIKESRLERNRRRERRTAAEEVVNSDIPPTYSEIVLRSDPPDYKESIMQEINPEDNPHWSEDLENEDSQANSLHPEVRQTITNKVASRAHGLLYTMLNHPSSTMFATTLGDEQNQSDQTQNANRPVPPLEAEQTPTPGPSTIGQSGPAGPEINITPPSDSEVTEQVEETQCHPGASSNLSQISEESQESSKAQQQAPSQSSIQESDSGSESFTSIKHMFQVGDDDYND